MQTKNATARRVLTLILLIAIMVLAGMLLAIWQSPGGFEAFAQRSKNYISPPSPTPEPTIVPTPEPTPAPTPVPTPEPTPDPEQAALELLRLRQEKEKHLLTLVNPWNPLPEDYDTDLIFTGFKDQFISTTCSVQLFEMLDDCRRAGFEPYVCSGYRTQEYQQKLFDNKILRLRLEGVSEEDAPIEAAKVVAVPGTSEHQLGLAADIIDYYYPILDEKQEDTGTQKWLIDNCWRYGFILRYPNGTTDITGIIYEPWHYRYVGLIAAQEIYERGITLEEYLELLYPGEY